MGKSTIQSYRDLLVWQKAVDLTLACYRVTRGFPTVERYGLSSQIQRAAVSVAANIAEGHGGKHLGDYLHHLAIAHGSLMELETHLIIAARLSYLRSVQNLLDEAAELGRMLNGLRANLKKQSPLGPAPDT